MNKLITISVILLLLITPLSLAITSDSEKTSASPADSNWIAGLLAMLGIKKKPDASRETMPAEIPIAVTGAETPTPEQAAKTAAIQGTLALDASKEEPTKKDCEGMQSVKNDRQKSFSLADAEKAKAKLDTIKPNASLVSNEETISKLSPKPEELESTIKNEKVEGAAQAAENVCGMITGKQPSTDGWFFACDDSYCPSSKESKTKFSSYTGPCDEARKVCNSNEPVVAESSSASGNSNICGIGCCEISYGKDFAKKVQAYNQNGIYGDNLKSLCASTPDGQNEGKPQQMGCCEIVADSMLKGINALNLGGTAGLSYSPWTGNTGRTVQIPKDATVVEVEHGAFHDVYYRTVDGRIYKIARNNELEEIIYGKTENAPVTSYVADWSKADFDNPENFVDKVRYIAALKLGGNVRGIKYDPNTGQWVEGDFISPTGPDDNKPRFEQSAQKKLMSQVNIPPKFSDVQNLNCNQLFTLAKTTCSSVATPESKETLAKSYLKQCRQMCMQKNVECRQNSLVCANKAREKTENWINRLDNEENTKSVPPLEVKGQVSDETIEDKWKTMPGCYSAMDKEKIDAKQYQALGNDCAASMIKLDLINNNHIGLSSYPAKSIVPYQDNWLIGPMALSPEEMVYRIGGGSQQGGEPLRFSVLNDPRNKQLYSYGDNLNPDTNVQQALAQRFKANDAQTSHYLQALKDSPSISEGMTKYIQKNAKNPGWQSRFGGEWVELVSNPQKLAEKLSSMNRGTK